MTTALLRIDRNDCLRLDCALSREWLETNGRGAYAAGTVPMCATRRYHGLLVAPSPGGRGRHVYLARFEESLEGPDRAVPLSIARYPGLWSPHGHKSLAGFELAPFPVFRYRLGANEVSREILLVRDAQTVLVRYALSGEQDDLQLVLRPLLPYREADALTHENLALQPEARPIRIDGQLMGISVQPYAVLPAIHITVSAAGCQFTADPVWYRNVEYEVDLQRGYEGHEDQFCPGVIRLRLLGAQPAVVAASIEEPVLDPGQLWMVESARRRAEAEAVGRDVRSILSLTANDFLFRTEGGRLGVLAGYPWYTERGRDTFVALPGLTLSRGLIEDCALVLDAAASYERGGLLPSRFGQGPDDSTYRSADAALWWVRAVRLYELAGGSVARIRERWLPVLLRIGQRYREGTDLGIGCDADGLLHVGAPGVAATWMSAYTVDGPVTPRSGCPVELNALWYFLIAYLTNLLEAVGDSDEQAGWLELRRRLERSFLDRFWLADEAYLADLWTEAGPDKSIRPNMVIAAALEFSPLNEGMREDVVRVAERHLLTPVGLRTLAPSDPQYRGTHGGGEQAHQESLHQGSAWPWLLGFYVEANLRAVGPVPQRIASLRELLDGLGPELRVGGLNHLYEAYDGDAPHRGGGAFAQAWNVGEILRAYALLEEADRCVS